MAGSSSMIIIIIMAAIVCSFVASGVSWYMNWTCPLGVGNSCSSTSTSDSTSDSATDPRQAVWSTGQSIQSAPLEIGTSSDIPFTTSPTGYATQTAPSYTITMDINVAKVAPGWRNIFEHGKRDTDMTNDWLPNDGGPGTVYRRPSLYIDAAGSYGTVDNCLVYVHSDTNNANGTVITPTIDIGKWFNITAVVDSGKMTLYYNGVEKTFPASWSAHSNLSTTFNWFATDQPWTWARKNYADPTFGSVQVGNVYFWPSALTAAQILTVGTIPSSAISGVATSAY